MQQLLSIKVSSPHFRLVLATLWWLFFCASRPVVVSQYLPENGSGTPDSSDLPYCSRTSDPNLSQKLRLEAIKHEILLRLGLDEAPPNPVNSPSELPTNDPVFAENYRAAQEVQKAHNEQQKPCTKLDTHEKKLLAFFPTNIEGFPPIVHPYLHAKGGQDIGNSNDVYNERYRLKFQVDLVDATSITNVVDDLKAELRLFIEPRREVTNSMKELEKWEERVEIRLIVRPEHYLNQELPIFITHQLLTPRKGYAVFDVSKAIKEWLSRNNGLSGELELDVLIRSPEAIRHGPAFEPNVQFSQEERTAQLVLTLYDKEEAKREAITAGYAVTNPIKCRLQCCWRPLVVNFRRDYNWTWITQPETMEFNYCSGECPTSWAVEGLHTRLLDRKRVLDSNPTAAPEPCCVPDSYEKQLFVLSVNNRTDMVWVEDARVTSCICR